MKSKTKWFRVYDTFDVGVEPDGSYVLRSGGYEHPLDEKWGFAIDVTALINPLGFGYTLRRILVSVCKHVLDDRPVRMIDWNECLPWRPALPAMQELQRYIQDNWTLE